MDTMTIQGQNYPVQKHVRIDPLGWKVPVLEIHMMSDERERELGAQSADKWKKVTA